MKSLNALNNSTTDDDPLSGVHNIKLYIENMKKVYDFYIGRNLETMFKMYIQYLIGDVTKDEI